jgi:hypothetical protein
MVLLLVACVPETVVVPPFHDPSPVAPATSIPSEPVPEGLVINEVQTRNGSTVLAPDGSTADWVELYNGGAEAVDLGRVTLSNGDMTWTGTGALEPGGRLVLWAELQDNATGLPFALSGDGESLTLAHGGRAVDRISTGPLPEDTAFARFPDGGVWLPTARPTPDQTNGSAPPDVLDPSDTLFDPSRVHRFDLLLSEDALAALRGSPYTQVEASLGFEGVWFRRVGVRIKGQLGSLRSIDAKPALKVDLNAYEPNGLRGVETLTFNNMVQDPTGLHETIGYEQLRALGIPAPRTGYLRLSINGDDRGFYTLMETPDENFLARWFVDPTGSMWEAAYGVDFWAGYEPYYEHDEGSADTAPITAVVAVLDAAGSAPTDADVDALDALIDLDQWLRVQAWEALALHWDGYTTANNYRIYLDPVDGRFRLIPWGIDQTWIDAWYGPWSGYGRVTTFCLANAGCRRRYDRTLVEVAEAVEAMDSPSRLAEVGPLVYAELSTDPNLEFGMDTHRAYVAATQANLEGRPAALIAAAELDYASIR